MSLSRTFAMQTVCDGFREGENVDLQLILIDCFGWDPAGLVFDEESNDVSEFISHRFQQIGCDERGEMGKRRV